MLVCFFILSSAHQYQLKNKCFRIPLNSKKDFWDIAMLLGNYPLKEMIRIFKEKFPQVDEGYIIHSLTDFEKAGNQFDPDSSDSITWEDVKRVLSEAVRGLTRDSL